MKRLSKITIFFIIILMFQSICFAAGANDSIDNGSLKRISKEKVNSLFNNTPMKLFSSNDNREFKNEFFSVIDKISELENEKLSIKNSSQSELIDREIYALKKSIEQMPIVKLTNDDLITVFGLKPSVPKDTSFVNFYGLTSTVTINKKRYTVFEIVAYSDLAYSSTNRTMYAFNDSVQLLGNGTYTQAQFSKAVDFVFDTGLGMITDTRIPGSSILLSIVNPSSFFGSSSRQSLELKYKANSYFVYAYVAEDGVNWYDFMQTSERMKLDMTVTGYSSNTAADNTAIRSISYHEGQYWSDVQRPAQRYANGNLMHEGYPVTVKRIYYNNIHKETIPLSYYNSLYSIPGV